jgi:hypothetical protein
VAKLLRWQVGRQSSQLFNLRTQKGPNWTNRALLAAELIREVAPRGASIADFGCGDQKLKEALCPFPCSYQGFDLLPQSNDVIQLDLTSDAIPLHFDVSVLLGVLEYIPVVATLQKMRSRLLIVSHVYPDEGAFPPSIIRERGWRNVLTKAQFEDALGQADYEVLRAVQTPKRMQYVWGCRRR